MKRRKYGDCQREDGNCAACSLSSYNRDCHGRAISKIEWYRLVNNMSVSELADASGVALRLIQRAEIVSYDDLVACGSMTAAKEKGLVRSEGKEYVMHDGDVVLFRFNV